MKKVFTFAVAGLLVSGVVFAGDKKKHCGKSCCKDKKECSKDMKSKEKEKAKS